MNRTTLAATATVVLLLLTGCTATTQPEPVASGDTASSAAPTASTAPLTAEMPAEAADSGEAPSTARDEAAFLKDVRETLRAENVIPNATDEQLVAAGLKACEMLDSGTPAEDITVIDGEQRIYGAYLDSFKIYRAAQSNLC